MAFIESLLARVGYLKRANLRNPIEEWLMDALGGSSETSSGIRVNAVRAMNCSAVFCAVTIIADAVKVLPLSVKQKRSDGGSDTLTGHPVHELLHVKPHGEFTPAQFKGVMQASSLLWSGGYAEINRIGGKLPVSLQYLHPSRVAPKRRSDDGKLVFDFTEDNGSVRSIENDNIIRIYGTAVDGSIGTSIVTLARESIGLNLATEKHGATFFGNGARPDGMLVHPGNPGPEARKLILESWNRRHQGPDKKHHTAVSFEGMEYKAIGLPNEVSQFLETRIFGVDEIARWFNLPPHKLKNLEHATFSNIEEQSIEFVTDTLMPRLVMWEEELTAKLLTPEERAAGLAVKFNVNALLRGNVEARGEFYTKMRNIGVYSVNEIRAMEDMNPIGPDGDIYLVPLNMTTPQKLLEADPNPQPKSGGVNDEETKAMIGSEEKAAVATAYRDLLEEVFTGAAQHEGRKILGYAGKPRSFVPSVDAFYDKRRDEMQTIIGPTIRAYLASVSKSSKALDVIANVAKQEAERSRAALLELAGQSKADTLKGNTEKWVGEMTATRPKIVTEQIIKAFAED